MLDGSPLICEGDGESYVNLVSETGENGGGFWIVRPIDWCVSKWLFCPVNYKAVIRATDGFMVEDEKRGTDHPCKKPDP